MYQPESKTATMYACESILKSGVKSENERDKIAYKNANMLLKSENITNQNKCTVTPGSLNFDPRGPMATMKIQCIEALKSNKMSGETWYIVVESKL